MKESWPFNWKGSVLMRKYLRKFFILLIIIFLGYYLFIIYDTREIMNEFRIAISDDDGTYDLKNEKLYMFRPHKNYKNVTVARYFTWCYKDKGKIWVYIKGEHTESDGEITEVPDYFSMSIEKKNGEWFVTRVNIIP